MEWLIIVGCITAGFIFYKFLKWLFHQRQNQPYIRSERNENRHNNFHPNYQVIWQEIPITPQNLDCTQPIIDISEDTPIEWTELSPNSVSEDAADINNRETAFNPTHYNAIPNLIDVSDPVTLAQFCPGDGVYFCQKCCLAYHEDSWQSISNKCTGCESDEYIYSYTLPAIEFDDA